MPGRAAAQEVRSKGASEAPVQQPSANQITGTVIDEETNEPLIGVSVSVVGRIAGTITDANGNFRLNVDASGPVKLRFSYVGFGAQEVDATAGTPVKIVLKPETITATEVVVSASRISESVLKAPVSIEKMDQLAVQTTPAANYYDALASFKAVDMTTVGLGFKAINTRGFNSQFNTRFVQRIDGMDNQAPGLQISLGNIVGTSDLDVESVELIPGAASALYGPNALNGLMNITTKDPFRYQGVSAMLKVGVNHVDNIDARPSPYYDLNLRYAKAFNDRFAFKITLGFLSGQDWRATDQTNVNANPSLQPNAIDRLNTYGDEVTNSNGNVSIGGGLFTPSALNPNASLYQNAFLFRPLLSPGPPPVFGPATSFFGLYSAAPGQAITSPIPGIGTINAPGAVSRTGYTDSDLFNPITRSYKATVALHYRINDKMEVSYSANLGVGNTIFMAADRYQLQNFTFQQHKLELKGDEFFLRAYTTIENSGETFNIRFAGYNINRRWVRAVNDVNGTGTPVYDQAIALGATTDQAGALADRVWFERYSAAYFGAFQTLGVGAGNDASARFYADRGRFDPTSQQYTDARNSVLKSNLGNTGSSIIDFTQMYHGEGQYDFKKIIKNENTNVLIGGNYRLFILGSAGTLFPDTVGNRITNWEMGYFAQLSQKFMDGRLRVTVSARADKNQNFDWQFSPRAGVAFDIAKNHTLRASVQQGFRIPTLQEQFIDLQIGNARLLGALPGIRAKYNLEGNVWTLNSVSAFGAAATQRILQLIGQGVAQSTAALLVSQDPNFTSLLQRYEFQRLKPEGVQTLEVGYKGLFEDKLFVDVSYYYSRYSNFIGSVVLLRPNTPLTGPNANLAPLDILQGNILPFQSYANASDIVASQGVSVGAEYNLPGNYKISANATWAELRAGSTDPLITAFNTPRWKSNVGFSNRSVVKNVGFAVNWRWSDTYQWAATFDPSSLNPATPRFVPAFNLIDAQVSYKVPKLKTIFKVGGSNILNNRHIEIWGGPTIGALYYVQISFDELMN
jgi:outer membrane receptor protein involved in Fe transport